MPSPRIPKMPDLDYFHLQGEVQSLMENVKDMEKIHGATEKAYDIVTRMINSGEFNNITSNERPLNLDSALVQIKNELEKCIREGTDLSARSIKIVNKIKIQFKPIKSEFLKRFTDLLFDYRPENQQKIENLIIQHRINIDKCVNGRFLRCEFPESAELIVRFSGSAEEYFSEFLSRVYSEFLSRVYKIENSEKWIALIKKHFFNESIPIKNLQDIIIDLNDKMLDRIIDCGLKISPDTQFIVLREVDWRNPTCVSITFSRIKCIAALIFNGLNPNQLSLSVDAQKEDTKDQIDQVINRSITAVNIYIESLQPRIRQAIDVLNIFPKELSKIIASYSMNISDYFDIYKNTPDFPFARKQWYENYAKLEAEEAFEADPFSSTPSNYANAIISAAALAGNNDDPFASTPDSYVAKTSDASQPFVHSLEP